MTIASVGLLLFAVVTAATGQVMLKHGMQIEIGRASCRERVFALV